jgi:hypothetical protein
MKTLRTMIRTISWMILLAATPGLAAELEGPYLGQKPPGPVPEVFAPGVISVEGSRERSLSISPKGDELFFSRITRWPHSKIMHMKRHGDKWSMPEPAAFLKDDWATQPVFSPDGQYLYYSTSRGKSDIRYFSLWRSKKVGDGWSEPESVLDMGGGLMMEFHPTVTRDGTLYFLYWDFLKNIGDIYVARPVGGNYTDPVIVGPPISTEYNEVRPTVDPDGRYLLFESDRPGGYGGTDIYISYKNDDGTWSSPRNLGPTVNTPDTDEVPNISPDGRYWFFMKNDDIYWREAPALPARESNNVPPAALPPQHALARDLLRELVEIDTTPTNGCTKAAEALAFRLRSAGFAESDVLLLGTRPDRQNLVVRLRGRGMGKPILFIAHLDVVDARGKAGRRGWIRFD